MHYYKFNIADYRKDTGHLSPIEHYIYRTLIDWYYLDEQPIPKETQMVSRRLRLDTEHEANLLNVLNDFFKLGEKGWFHERIDSEIASYHGLADRNKANGSKGGRPKKQQVTEEKTQSVSSGLPDESQKNPNHKPETINQEPILEISNDISLDAVPKPVKQKKARTVKTFTPPTLEEVSKYANENGRGDLAVKFFEYYEAGDWHDSKGNPVRSWKQKFKTWIGNNQQPVIRANNSSTGYQTVQDKRRGWVAAITGKAQESQTVENVIDGECTNV